MDLFRVRLNCVDHYQATPIQFDPELRRNVPPYKKKHEPRVPVIRVFGATETGQKVCAHVHGAFPYLYIEYNGDHDLDALGNYISRLHLSIDHALAVSYRRNPYEGKNDFVARITLVKGIPFYGFHVGYKYFLKIYMLDPMVMTRLADLFRQGDIMNKIFQPFEAHLQYLLQWMTDYNLYGCGYMDCKRVFFRGPVPKYEELDKLSHLWHDRSVPKALLLAEGVLPRVSHCSIEVDVCVQDILNRLDIKPRPLHHDFVERLNPLAPAEKLVHSMAGLWKDETRRRKSRMVDLDPASSPFPPEVMISMSADSRNTQRGGWIHEVEYMAKVRALILDEKATSDGSELSFESFIAQSPLESLVKTAFEAVEDLYPQNLDSVLGLKIEKAELISDGLVKDEEMDVDVNHIPDFNEHEDFPYDSDEEVMREMDLSQRKQKDQIEKKSPKLLGTELVNNMSYNPISAVYEKPPEQMNDRAEPKAAVAEMSQPNSTINVQTVNWRLFVPSNSTTTAGSKVVPSTLDSGLGVKRNSSQMRTIYGDQKRQKILNAEGLQDETLTEFIRAASQAEVDTMITSSKEHLLKPKARESHSKEHLTTARFSTVNDITRKATTDGLTQSFYQEPLNLNSNFPVVKDPQDQSTVMRLSQGSSSQKLTSSSSSKKQVSFDASVHSSDTPRNLEPKTFSSTASDDSTENTSRLLQTMLRGFITKPGTHVMAIGLLPPTSSNIVSSMEDFGLPSAIYQDAYYGNEDDVPGRVREWAGQQFKLESLTVPFLPNFDPTGSSLTSYGEKPAIVLDKGKEEILHQRRRRACKLKSWEFAEPPPTRAELLDWLQEEKLQMDSLLSNRTANSRSSRNQPNMNKLSQIDGPTQKNEYDFSYTQLPNATSVHHEAQYMSTMSLEVHVNTRGKFVPNPEEDEIQCIFWCLQADDDGLEHNRSVNGTQVGIVTLSEDGVMAKKIAKQASIEVIDETSELDLLVRIVEIVRNHDPDILTGFEVHGSSWGYIIERARLKYDYNLCDELSRMKSQSHGRFGRENDKWGFNKTSTIRVTGRHMINIWRAMRSELNLLQYTMENVAYHLLHRRIPHYSWQDLTAWYTNGKLKDLAKVVNYYVSRVQIDLEILDQNELIPRTSEQARLLGVDFFSVFSRGSQFKVESLMFRIAKPENFILASPSRNQVGAQNALECLPMVMEPQSAFYNSPLLVLDFQSLYPSVMIAYNYCYSTFLGRVVSWRGVNKMGFTNFKRQERLLELLQGQINIAPNGMMYVKPEIRKSLLAKMLSEILETRVMVKSGMKIDKEDITLQRLLNNRQLALKLIANVTYGYTSASFSGRMPCSEIADSIVQTARETLEKAIALIHSENRWGAEVVYGDTDSLFIYLKGRTKDQAFDIGEEIAKKITNMNPRPVKLKFEKVYFPCVLLAKKRYVGFKYESRDQKEPEFDAKGIETVRRDGTPAEQKIEEKALKILFRTADLSQVKSYFQEQCNKIMRGSVSIQDFCFAKEVRLGTYSEKGIPPPGALISTRRMLEDHRAEPQYGERVPYVVITGAPGARLIDRCVAPETLLHSDTNELDAEYYISKNLIPPLERIFNLVGANVRAWYDEMPKVQRIRRVDPSLQLLGQSKNPSKGQRTLESYMKSSSCLVCRDKLKAGDAICASCLAKKPVSLLTLRTRLTAVERKVVNLERICRSCSGVTWGDEVRCDSKDCPVFYSRTKQNAKLAIERSVVDPVMRLLQADPGDLEW